MNPGVQEWFARWLEAEHDIGPGTDLHYEDWMDLESRHVDAVFPSQGE